MVRAPYPARIAAGLVVTALEETRKLPTLVVTLPMTAVSQTLQAGMRVQQNIAELAIKGDLALESLFDRPDEQPEWAQFDDDDVDTSPAEDQPATTEPDTASGRFALYSSPPEELVANGNTATGSADEATSSDDASVPEIVEYLEYDLLTLAQLRAKLRSVSLAELEELAAYERSTKARAPFITMIENRIASQHSKRQPTT